MAEIKQAKFIDQTGQEKDAVFVGAEKAIYDDSGKRLDQKLEEREKATGLLASDTQGILGNIGAEVSLQSIIDKVAEKIMRELVSNSSLTQTLANYMTTAMMSGEQIDDGNKVPTSALAFAMNQAITQNKNAITQLNSDLGKDYWSTVGKVEVISPNSWHKSNISITLPPGTYILGYKAHGNISANAYINTKIDNAAESFPLYEKEINMPLSIADGSTLRSVSNVVMRLNNSEVTLYFWAYSTIVTSITCEVWAIRIK